MTKRVRRARLMYATVVAATLLSFAAMVPGPWEWTLWVALGFSLMVIYALALDGPGD